MKFLSLFLMSFFISFKSFCADAGLVAVAMQSDLIAKFGTLCDAKIAELEESIAASSGVSGGGENPYESGDDADAWQSMQDGQRALNSGALEENRKDLAAWENFRVNLQNVFTVEFIQELNATPSASSKKEAIQARATEFQARVRTTTHELPLSTSDLIEATPKVSEVRKIKEAIVGMGAKKFAETRNLYMNTYGQWVSNQAAVDGLGADEFGRRRDGYEGGGAASGSDALAQVPVRATGRVTVDPGLSSAMAASGFGRRPPVSYGDELAVEAVDDPRDDYCPSASAGFAGSSAAPSSGYGGMSSSGYGGTGMTSVGGYSSVYGRGVLVSASPPATSCGGYGGMGSSSYGALGVYGSSASAASSLPALTNGDVDDDEALRLAMEASVLDARRRADSDEAPTGPVYEGDLTDQGFQELSMMIRYHDGSMVDNPAEAADYFDAQVRGNDLETNLDRQIFIDSVNRLLTEEGFNKASFDAVVESFLHRGK